MWVRFVAAPVLVLAITGCSALADSEPRGENDFAQIEQELLGSSHDVLRALCDHEFELEHMVDVGNGVRLHVRERFSGRSVLRAPRRALLMIPPTLATNEIFDATVDGDLSYNALHRAAERGYFGFAVSYEGYGDSTAPEDGKTVTGERSLAAVRKVLQWIRRERAVPRVDLFGMSLGAGIAIALGGEDSPQTKHAVNRILVSAFVYETFSPELASVFTPEFQEFLEGLPGGFLTTGPEFYAPVISALDPDAMAWALATLPDTYAVGPTLEAFDLPFFEAENGRAPLLQLWGTLDPVTPLSDVEQFQSEYGGPNRLAVLEGGAHSLHLEPVRDQFWREAFAFLKEGSPHGFSVCDQLAPKNWH
ncbi:MAG TPA: alpha/beta hydrolase [Polyangiaceae bacterium]|nr:alpha/beta hydrolase [Polyangiaceae bacterium]